jgi:LDH2 family malate/lactate/ureidoglycolate dehydrogenase
MDEYIQAIGKLEPLENFDESLLPGAIEAKRTREYTALGIPVGPQHRERLEGIAKYLDLDVPW